MPKFMSQPAIRSKRYATALVLLLAAPGAHPAVTHAADATAESVWFDTTQTVESSTRYPKPLVEVAENVTIITAADIERMNAHNLQDVLARAPGVFMDYSPQEYNGTAQIHIQGSREMHVLVLLDGVRLNTTSSGDAQLYSIHPSAVDRIEVVKGPASSAWGSSLGGVVNIFTKKAGKPGAFQGSLAGSYGVMRSSDVNGEFSGGAGKLGYYVNASRQDSDGLRNDRFWEADSLYAKLSLDLPHQSRLTGTFGFNEPYFRLLHNDWTGSDQQLIDRTRLFTLGFDSVLAEKLTLYVGARQLQRDWNGTLRNFAASGGLYPGAGVGEMIDSTTFEEDMKGVNAHLAWTVGRQTLALGGEYQRGRLDKHTLYGPFRQGPWPPGWSAPAESVATPGEEEVRSVYANDTIHLGDWALTPGLRYDDHSIAGGIVSPSLGLTWRASGTTLFRALVARGFVQPLLADTSLNDFALAGNRNLEPEVITSWQAGAETTAIPYLRAKATVFLHQVEDEWWQDLYNTYAYQNGHSVDRPGLELELETVKVHDFSLAANYTFIRIEPEDDWGAAAEAAGMDNLRADMPHAFRNDTSQVANVFLRYDRPERFSAELAGHYIWWDEFYTVSAGHGRGEYSAMLWDLTVSRNFATEGVGERMKVFASGHNLFSGSQTSNIGYMNPDLWVEAGMKWWF